MISTCLRCHSKSSSRKILLPGAPEPSYSRFMVPMHSEKRKRAFHEPQVAAGVLPTEESERSSAGETSAAPCSRHSPTRSRFMVPLDGHKTGGLSMNPPTPDPSQEGSRSPCKTPFAA